MGHYGVFRMPFFSRRNKPAGKGRDAFAVPGRLI